MARRPPPPHVVIWIRPLSSVAAGKAKVLQAATALVGAGPYYANGGTFTGAPAFANVSSNLEGKWGGDQSLWRCGPQLAAWPPRVTARLATT